MELPVPFLKIVVSDAGADLRPQVTCCESVGLSRGGKQEVVPGRLGKMQPKKNGVNMLRISLNISFEV